MAYFDELNTYKDPERLQRLTEQVCSFLSRLAFTPTEVLQGLNFRTDRLRESIQKAWMDEVLPRAEALVGEVKRVTLSRARRAGLAGASLSAKIEIMSYWESMLSTLGGRALRWLLAAINSFLGSLLAILRAHEAIKEAKDMLENSLDYDSE